MEEYLKPLSIELTETLPGFLANALHDLIRNPDEFARLRSEKELVPRAAEELLRHAGPVHTLVRTATAMVMGAFTRKFVAAELSGPLQWREGSTRRAPESLPVILRR
jgi:hypothetical protein